MKKVCFYNLDAFATTGGIEKFNRAFLYGLKTLNNDNIVEVQAASMYDSDTDEKYFPKYKYRSYSKKKVWFIFNEFFRSFQYDLIILGHINLSLFGLLIKIFYPKKKVYLIAHGVEIWDKQNGLKEKFLKKVDKIFAVSEYTKSRIVETNWINESKIKIFYNTIDPYFNLPKKNGKSKLLLDRHLLDINSKIILSLARLKHTELRKGYDRVIEILPNLLEHYPDLVYLIAGKSDEYENNRLCQLVIKHNVTGHVIFLGYIPDAEIEEYYQLADCFVMPSQKEGFGIVYIEAMACGLPVIAGNRDGSVDALDGGNFGTLVNPDSNADILQAILNILGSSDENKSGLRLQKSVIDKFGYNRFYENLKILVNE